MNLTTQQNGRVTLSRARMHTRARARDLMPTARTARSVQRRLPWRGRRAASALANGFSQPLHEL
eukprot:6191234-Pleurochrysis_carterae.AAC.1